MMRDFSILSAQYTLNLLSQTIEISTGDAGISLSVGAFGSWVDKLGIGVYLDKVEQFKRTLMEKIESAKQALWAVYEEVWENDRTHGLKLLAYLQLFQKYRDFLSQIGNPIQAIGFLIDISGDLSSPARAIADSNMSLFHNLAEIHYLYNLQFLSSISCVYDDTGHINGQDRDPINKMLFGLTRAGNVSCETIAVANVLHDLGRDVPLAEIVYTAEDNGYMFLGGFWGVKPWCVDNLMSKYGIQYKKTTKEEINDNLNSGIYDPGQPFVAVAMNNAEGFIVPDEETGKAKTYGIHTFEIVYNPDGDNNWTVYNRYNNSEAGENYESLDDIVKNGTITGSYIALYQIDGTLDDEEQATVR